WPWSGFHRFLAFTWVPLLVLLALASVQDLAHRWALPLGLLASVVVVRVEVGWARLWSNWLGGAIGPAVQRHRGRWHLGVALLFFALVWGLPLLIRWTDTGPEEPALSGEWQGVVTLLFGCWVGTHILVEFLAQLGRLQSGGPAL